MPILDPVLQYHLLERKHINDEAIVEPDFYLRYLHIASRHINTNFTTFQASILFKNDLKANIQSINYIFGCMLLDADFNNPFISNYYSYLYNQLINGFYQKDTSVKGKYFLQVDDISTKFFQPNIFFSSNHSWYLSDTPIAVLCINFDDFSYNENFNDFFQLIKLEINILAASGFTLVFCSNYSQKYSSFLIELINRNQFAEVHFNILTKSDIEHFLIQLMKADITIDQFKGFFYLYSPFIDENTNYYDNFKRLKKSPHFYSFLFSFSLKETLKSIQFKATQSFSYCKTGFKKDKIRIRLSNFPLYDSDSDENGFIPSDISGLKSCYVYLPDFFNWKNKRVKIIIDDEIKFHSYEKYINFDDIHKIRKDLYAVDMLLLGKVEVPILESINKLDNKIKSELKKEFKKQKSTYMNFTDILSNNVQIAIANIATIYALTHPLKRKFHYHRPQLYTILKSIQFILSESKSNNNEINSNSIENIISNNLKSLLSDPYLSQKMKGLIAKGLVNINKKSIELFLEENSKKNKSDNKKSKNKYDLFFGTKNDSKSCSRGVIYQVETGEGKSCIISLIAAILALSKKTVHIASSNIKLANRDYIESFDFYKKLGIKSAVFLHDSELPYSIKKSNIYQNKQESKSNTSEEQKQKDMTNEKQDTNKEQKQKDRANEKQDTSEEQKLNFSSDSDSDSDSYYDNEEEEEEDFTNINDFSNKINNESSSSILNSSSQEIQNEIDFRFKDNADNYYRMYTQSENNTEYAKCYFSKDVYQYYTEERFKNPLRMNFTICGLDVDELQILNNKPNVIFSTFVNFECLYLKMLEVCPAYIDDYFDNCVLLIDEADSILIDEITDGTILSKEINSNLKEVLQFVYKNKKNKISAEKTLESIKTNWPKCTDINLDHIKKMYSEIDIVYQKEFTNGKKYSIEEFEVINEKKKSRIIKKVLKCSAKILFKIGKALKNELFLTDGIEEEDDDDDDEDEDDEEDEDEDDKNDNSKTVFRHIVPFDYDHKGILEPNKAFGGFIQQFIAIKESEENNVENIVINDMYMNYMYVSHPIFVKLYGKVCGFTGTIGSIKERTLYTKQYDLSTQKVPRNRPNQRVQFPTILCKSIHERNEKIFKEVIEFHKKENPVLVIFQDLKEIEDFGYLLFSRGIHFYNVFNGKDEKIRPERVAGQKSSISLGTNICGRGTNIIIKDKPLHVIISYYTSNSRVINQAHGRTARQGKRGTSRIICLEEHFLNPILFSGIGVNESIIEFQIKDKLQAEYIELFKELKPWVFKNIDNYNNFRDYEIKCMREARINVNRIVAFNFEFPVKMSTETFLKIQSQKIFSIVNCPNSKYTWRLFQRYIREMILQSWSLMMTEFDESFFEQEENKKIKKVINESMRKFSLGEGNYAICAEAKRKFPNFYMNYEIGLKKSRNKLLDLLHTYLPIDMTEMSSLFMYIFKKTVSDYEQNVLQSFNEMSNVYSNYNDADSSVSFQTGFRPYSLLTESGARITHKNSRKINYIKDPELKYLKRTPKNFICLLSITEQIDDIFNKIFQKINQLLGNKTFLKFFLRRTLYGCEFGVCFDFLFDNEGIDDPNCIIDKDPMLLFTINVSSFVPVLAGVLIICLVYLASIAKDIAEWIVGFPEKLTKELLIKGIFIISSVVGSELVSFALDKFINFLNLTLNKQIDKLKVNNHSIAAKIIETLKTVFESSIGEHINSKISSILGDKIKCKFKWQSFIKNCVDPERVMKISILLLLCFASFITNFNSRKDAIKNENEDSMQYDNSKEKNKLDILMNKNKEKVNEERGAKLKDKETKTDKEKISSIGSSFEKVSKTFLYEFKNFDPFGMAVKFTEFVDDNKDAIEDSFNLALDVKSCIQKKGVVPKRAARFEYSGFRDILFQQIRIYATNKCPSILNAIGYSIHKKRQYLFIENKGNGTLLNIINKSKNFRVNQTQKIIIAYGVACALESLHKNNIIHRNIKPSSISLDKKFLPYLSDFYCAVQIDTKLPHLLKESTPEFMAPEFIEDFKANQLSFKLDVYSYAIVMFMIFTENNPFLSLSQSEILSRTVNGQRPEFTVNINQKMKKLIVRCWNQDPSKRPDFTNICDKIEKLSLKDEIDFSLFNKYKKKFNRKP